MVSSVAYLDFFLVFYTCSVLVPGDNMDLGDLADLAGLDLSVLESFKDFKPKNMSEPKFSVPSAFPGAHMGANINMDNILDHFEGLKRKSSLNYTSIEDQDDQMLPNQDFSNISLDHGLDDTIKSMLNDFRTSIDSTGEIKRSVFYSLLVIYILAIIVGFCGNLLIVTAVLGRKRMRTARNVFIVTLAISDTTLCIFTMPFTLWEVRNTFMFIVCTKFLTKNTHTMHAQYLGRPTF